jgi:hypothetical protein
MPAQRVVVTARRVLSTRQRKPSDDHEHAAVEREAGSAYEAQGDQEALVPSPGIGEGQREPARGELGGEREREDSQGGRGPLPRLLLDLAAHCVEARVPPSNQNAVTAAEAKASTAAARAGGFPCENCEEVRC